MIRSLLSGSNDPQMVTEERRKLRQQLKDWEMQHEAFRGG